MADKSTTPVATTTGTGTGTNAGGTTQPHSTPNFTGCQNSPMLAHALRYALAGWQVIPLQPGGKAPITKHGVKDASGDPEQIADWWKRWPTANIGLAIGAGRAVLDIDPRNGGQLGYLDTLGLDYHGAPFQHTAGGGWHVVVQVPINASLAGNVSGMPGLDILSGARYIVAAPSIVAGRSYRWERHPLDVEPPRLPLHLIERLLRTRPAAARPTGGQTRACQQDTSPAPDAPPLAELADALKHIPPWDGDYNWWLHLLFALHSAYPGADGLALAVAWGDGAPGEIASKWAAFNRAGGVTWRLILSEAGARGWRPSVASGGAVVRPTRETAHEILHNALKTDGGNCPICGRSFFETAIEGGTVHLRRRVMMCHRRGCLTWQTHKIERQIMEREPWRWDGWYVSQHSEAEYRRLVNGPLADCRYIGVPLVTGDIGLFAEAPVRESAVPVACATMLEMAAERMLTIPSGKRLRVPKQAARAKRANETATATAGPEPVEEPRERLRWARFAFGVDLLTVTEAWQVLAIAERAGATVTPQGRASWPVAIDTQVREAISNWIRPERPEIDAYDPTPAYAPISGAPLPEPPAWAYMRPSQRRYARLIGHRDANRAAIARA